MRILSILTILLWLSFSPKSLKAEIIDKIVAQVGSQVVTLHDVQKFAPAQVRSINDQTNTSLDWDTYYRETLDFLIYDKTLEIAASRVGVNATDEEIENMIVVLQNENTQFREQVSAILEREGAVTPGLSLLVKQIIIKDKLMRMLASRSIVTEADIRRYISANNPDAQAEHTEYNVDVAFVPDERTLGVFHKAIDTQTMDLAAKGVGGTMVEMGWVRMDDLVGDIRADLANITKGELSRGTKDSSGRYMVVRLNDTRTVTNVSEDERNYITYMLRTQQLNQIFENWLARQKESIIVNQYE
jgi:hypothetical protein